MVRNISEHGLTPAAAAAAAGVSEPTTRKWLGRFLAGGQAALADASSRPASSPRRISESKALAIVELRKRRLTQARIAISPGVSEATVSRVLRRAGLSKLSALQPADPVQRYEHAAPGELLHIDTKKLGRIERMSHRVASERLARRQALLASGDPNATLLKANILALDRGQPVARRPCRNASSSIA